MRMRTWPEGKERDETVLAPQVLLLLLLGTTTRTTGSARIVSVEGGVDDVDDIFGE